MGFRALCPAVDPVCYHCSRRPVEGGLAGLRWKAAD